MLKLQSRKVEYVRKSDGVKDSFMNYYIEFEAGSHSKANDFKFTYDVKIADNNWKELLNKHIDTATICMKPVERTKDGKIFTIYQPQVRFMIDKTPFFFDFKVEEKAVLFLLKVYCL